MYKGLKVILREPKEEDIIISQKWMNDLETRRLLSDGSMYPYTLNDQKEYYSNIKGNNETYGFAIETLDGVLIGNCGIEKVNWKNSKALVGILIGEKSYWGRGYGSDAITVLISFIFNELGLNKVELAVFSYNERAINSYKKCGFKEEGRKRQSIYSNGKFHDEVLMGILKEEWKSIKK